MNPLLLRLAGTLPSDSSWFRDVNDFARATPWLHGTARAFASYGLVLFAALLLAGWWSARGRNDRGSLVAALWAPLGMLLALALNQPLGQAVGEARPYAALPDVLVLVHRTTDFSFPSDHAVMAGAVAAGVLLANRRLGAVAVVAALLMAATRVYVGAHYPGDVLAGLTLGALVTVVGYPIARPVIAAIVRRLEATPLKVLVASP